jgi:hypothetical protein
MSRVAYQGRSFQQSYSPDRPGLFHFKTHIIQALLKTLSPIPKSSLTWYSGLHPCYTIRRVDGVSRRVVNYDLGMMPSILVPLYLILKEHVSITRALSARASAVSAGEEGVCIRSRPVVARDVQNSGTSIGFLSQLLSKANAASHERNKTRHPYSGCLTLGVP